MFLISRKCLKYLYIWILLCYCLRCILDLWKHSPHAFWDSSDVQSSSHPGWTSIAPGWSKVISRHDQYLLKLKHSDLENHGHICSALKRWEYVTLHEIWLLSLCLVVSPFPIILAPVRLATWFTPRIFIVSIVIGSNTIAMGVSCKNPILFGNTMNCESIVGIFERWSIPSSNQIC